MGLLSPHLDPFVSLCLFPTSSCHLLLSLYLSASPSLCSCLLPRETESGDERKLMKTGICGNGDRDGVGGGGAVGKRRDEPHQECNMSRMIMTSESFPLLSLSTVVMSQRRKKKSMELACSAASKLVPTYIWLYILSSTLQTAALNPLRDQELQQLLQGASKGFTHS